MIDALLLTVALTLPGRDPLPSVTLSREAFAAHSSRADDLRGPAPSLYMGAYYHPDQETFRRCVADREGSFTYNIVGGAGNNYQSTYQFHDGNWRRGLTYMMAAESATTRDGLRAEARQLAATPIAHWGRYWLDRAFYTALNHDGKWAGRHHWDGGSHPC